MKLLLNIQHSDNVYGTTVDCFLLNEETSIKEVAEYPYNRLEDFFEKCLTQHGAECILLQEHKIDRFGDNDTMRYTADINGKNVDICEVSYQSVKKVPRVEINDYVSLCIVNPDDNVTALKVKENGNDIIELSSNKDSHTGYLPSFIVSVHENLVYVPGERATVKLHRGYKRYNK